MTPELPFLTRLSREADRHADFLTVTAVISSIVSLSWSLMHWMGIVPAVPLTVAEFTLFWVLVWLAFRTVAILIDYALFAFFAALSEWMVTALTAVQTVHAPVDPESEDAPDQRPSSIAYLHDFLHRPRQVTSEAEPLNPTPPTAA